MPNVNPQHKTILPSSFYITQQAYSNNIVQPIIILVTRLKHHSQLQSASRLRRPGRLKEDIRAIVRAEIVARVGAKNTSLRIRDAPVGAEIEDFAWIEVSVVVFLSGCLQGWLRDLEVLGQ